MWTDFLSFSESKLKEDGFIDFTRINALDVMRTRSSCPVVSREMRKFTQAIHSATSCRSNPYDELPDFRRSGYIDGYRLGVIGIFSDLQKKNARTTAVYTSIIPLNATVSPLTFGLYVPEGSTDYVVCLKIEGCVKDIVNNVATSRRSWLWGAGGLGIRHLLGIGY